MGILETLPHPLEHISYILRKYAWRQSLFNFIIPRNSFV